MADMEAAKAVDAPALLENGGIDVEDAAWLERAGIEHDEIRRGAHHIKIMGNGGISSPTDRISSRKRSCSPASPVKTPADRP